MKSNLKTKIMILIILGILFALLPIIYNSLNFNGGNSDRSSGNCVDFNLDNKNLQISAVSGKIHIDNNWSAAEAVGICTGNGTYSDPYIIEDLVIDGGGSGNGIWIENSNVYFKIENCTVYNSGSYPNAGIRLDYIDNAQLINNNCSFNKGDGIHLWDSNNNKVSGNIANNNYWYGIHLRDSNNNKVSGNTANKNNWFGISLASSNYSVVSGNTANKNNWFGIYLWDSNNNKVSGNTANNNDYFGISLIESDYNKVSGNTANYNDCDGIEIDSSNNNIISENTVNDNSQIGIILAYSNWNNVYLNCFNNTLNAFDGGSNNHWDNGIKGNYWADYTGLDADGNGIGDVPYNITGSAGSQDNFPLMKCPLPLKGTRGIPIELIILISIISGGAVIGVVTILLIRRKRKRIE